MCTDWKGMRCSTMLEHRVNLWPNRRSQVNMTKRKFVFGQIKTIHSVSGVKLLACYWRLPWSLAKSKMATYHSGSVVTSTRKQQQQHSYFCIEGQRIGKQPGFSYAFKPNEIIYYWTQWGSKCPIILASNMVLPLLSTVLFFVSQGCWWEKGCLETCTDPIIISLLHSDYQLTAHTTQAKGEKSRKILYHQRVLLLDPRLILAWFQKMGSVYG